ncbi:anthranilate synthase component I [Halobacteriales archaeon QS_8_69_26]|nr:MAG: anthranilate synthase component I [Halobacteriales archaeon QS_8_69_26]
MSDVETESVAVDLSPVEVYRRVDGRALLERGERGWRETYVATDPVASFRYRRTDDGDGLERLRAWLDSVGTGTYDTEAGAFGYVGYDVAKEIEDLPDDTVRDFDLPDIAFDCYDAVLKVREGSVLIEAVDHGGRDGSPGERVRELAERLRSDDGGHEAERDGRSRSAVRSSEVGSNFDRADYLAAVETVKEYIREGDTFQANISQRLGFTSDASPLELYAALRETNPGPYMGLLEYDGAAIVSSSPELLVRTEGRDLKARPIAGTRPRGETDRDDDDLRSELTASEKERAEHSILVDLTRNDLGTVSTHGSVTVDRFMDVVPYAEVQHLESVVAGELRDGKDLVDAIRAVFPGGTVTGAPKPRTLEIIEEVEPTERGPYTGSMGRIGLDGDATMNILIRTVVNEGDQFYLQVGGGVVHDSEPVAEYEETLQKAEGVLNALETSGRGDEGDQPSAARTGGPGGREGGR